MHTNPIIPVPASRKATVTDSGRLSKVFLPWDGDGLKRSPPLYSVAMVGVVDASRLTSLDNGHASNAERNRSGARKENVVLIFFMPDISLRKQVKVKLADRCIERFFLSHVPLL